MPRRLALPLAALALGAAPVAAHADAPSWAARIDAVAGPAMDGLIRAQRSDGTFRDAAKGTVGTQGLPKAGFAAAHQAARLTPAAAASRAQLAKRLISRGLGGRNVLDKWAVALWAQQERATQGPLSVRLDNNLRGLGVLHAPGIADACFQRPRCFNNYSLVSRVLDLELAHSGLRSGVKGTRLARPHLRDEALRWLRDVLPRTTSASARVVTPGAGGHTAAALSDPSTYPLAYQTLCTALLVRAARLGGARTPVAVWRLLRAALWENVGMTAPNGEITWLGRGQDEVWTLAANLYAGLEGSVLMARRDPALAARLRRLAEVELSALTGRLTDQGLAQTPLARAGRAGIDHYASAVGNAALALVWMELARDAAGRVSGPVRALPAEVSGGRASDPRGNGLLTLRRGDVWLGVHRRRDHALDARQDFGLLRALRRTDDGRWVALLPARPIVRPGRPSPVGGPSLVRRGGVVAPVTTSGGVDGAAVRLRGSWGGVPARWTFHPGGGGVQLTSTCPRGAQLQLTAFLPVDGSLTRTSRGLARGGYRVRFSQPARAALLPGTYGSAREPRLSALRVRTTCSGRPLTVTYQGDAVAKG